MSSSSPPRVRSCVPVPLDESKLMDVIERAKDWALMHGVSMRDHAAYNKDAMQIAPFTLLPSPFPRIAFRQACRLQPILNELLHKVAHDVQFLEETLANTLEVDEFTAGLYNIWQKVREEGIAQPISLGLLRSDIMLETRCSEDKLSDKPSPYCSWKQVEINSIACGFGHLGPVMREIHSYILKLLGHGDQHENMPENKALSGLCGGILRAYDLFSVPNSIILFVVEKISYSCNICDQCFHEFEITDKRPDIIVLWKTLKEIYHEASLNDKKQLIIDNRPVAVVYYRAGYKPDQYPTCQEWEARLRVEQSTAIKSPSIQYQLAGTKKVQQALAREGAVERYILEGTKARAVREIFAGLYSLDLDNEGDRSVKMVMDEDESKYVLKPQREGGGNNVYGADVRKTLQRLRHSRERAAYILMERITPPIAAGYVVRAHAPMPPSLVDLVYELGIFGVIIGRSPYDSEFRGKKILENRQVGHMLKSKLAGMDEGGVTAGFGALDSPYLFDI